jgi:prolyl-tRNA synthetase
VQVVVVPVPYKGKEKEVNEACAQVVETLKNAGYRVKLDDRNELTPGNKFYYWELRGVPIRVEIGPRDLANGVVTVVRRDSLKKKQLKMDEVVTGVHALAETIATDLKTNAEALMKERIYRVTRLSEAKSLLKRKTGIVEVPWCGNDDCGHKLEEEVDARLLGIPEDIPEKIDGTCVICGEPADNVVRVASAY